MSRFKQLQDKLEAKGNDPKKAAAIAAYVGRKKYGNKTFQKMAAAGRRAKGKK